MIKAILFDADGVTLVKHGYFSERYIKEYHVLPEKVRPFFREKFGLCQKGKSDLRQEIQPYLAAWGWKGTVDDFLNYWFTSDFEPNKEVLDVIRNLRAKGIKCYLVTDQEKYRAEYLKNVVKFDENFDGTFYSYNLGYRKSDAEFFEAVIKDLNLKYDEVLYLDDEEENITVATEAGINSKLYRYDELFKLGV